MYGFSSCFLNDSIKPAQRESGSLPPCWVRSFTHRGVRIGAKDVRQRLRFTRALLESKDLFMWFCLPLYVWVSGHNPSSVETTPEQRSPRSAFPPCWEPGIIGGRKSKPPSGKKMQPTSLCLEASICKEWVSFSRRRPPDLLRR